MSEHLTRNISWSPNKNKNSNKQQRYIVCSARELEVILLPLACNKFVKFLLPTINGNESGYSRFNSSICISYNSHACKMHVFFFLPFSDSKIFHIGMLWHISFTCGNKYSCHDSPEKWQRAKHDTWHVLMFFFYIITLFLIK